MYIPWRSENELVSNKQSYEKKFKHVELLINSTIKRHKPFINIAYDDLDNSLIFDLDEDIDNGEFAMINPDFDDVSSTHTGCKAGIRRTSINNIFLPNDQGFFEMCYQFNEEQQHLFNFMMRYAVKCCLAEKYHDLLPDAFQIFLSGGTGVGKSFLVTGVEITIFSGVGSFCRNFLNFIFKNIFL